MRWYIAKPRDVYLYTLPGSLHRASTISTRTLISVTQYKQQQHGRLL